MVGIAGFEPTTFRSRSGRAPKLRHIPLCYNVFHIVMRETLSPIRDLNP